MKKLLQTSVWELLNIPNDEAMTLNDNVFQKAYNGDGDKYKEFQDALAPFVLGETGFIELYNMLQAENKQNPDPLWADNKVPSLKSFYSATGHYSIPKAVSVLGMG